MIEDPRTDQIGPLRRLGQALSWLAGLVLLLLGASCLTTRTELGFMIVGWGATLAGGLLLPPISGWARSRIELLRPIWAPPSLSIGLFLVTAVSGSILAASEQPAPPAPVPAPSPPQSDQREKPRVPGAQAPW